MSDDESRASSDVLPISPDDPRGGVCREGAGRLDEEAGEGGRHSGRTDSSQRMPSEVHDEGDSLKSEDSEPSARVETRLRWEGPGQLVYEPRLVRTGPDRYAVEAKREERGLIPWGFFGGLLFVGVLFAAIVGAGNFYTFWDILWVLLGLTAGGLMYRFGRHSSLRETLLCHIDTRRGVLEWPEGAQSGLGEMVLGFDDVTEIVFGMTALPVDAGTPEVRVDAFALLVRSSDEELIPVVEGSPYKENVHELAKFLAAETETELTYVGRGMS